MKDSISFFKSSVITFGSKIILFSLSLAVGVLLTRALGPSGRGEFALYFSLVMLIMVVSKTGIEISSMYFISRNEGNREDIAGTCLTAGLLFGFLGGCCPFVFFKLAGRTLYPGYMDLAVYASMITIPGLLLKIYVRLLLLSARRIYSFNMINWINQVFMLIGILIVIQVGVSVDRMIIVHVISIFASTIIALYILHRANLLYFRFNFSIFLKLLKFGIPTSVGNTCKNLLLKIDIIILGYFTTIDLIGFYSVGVGFSELMFKLPESLSGLIMHWTAKNSRKTQFIETVYRNLFYIVLAGTVVMIIAAYPVIHLLYPGFERAAQTAYILLPAVWMYCMFSVLGSFLVGNAYNKEYMLICIFSLVCNVILNLIFIPFYDIQGAAIATLFSYSILHLSALYIAVVKGKCHPSGLFILTRRDLYNYYQKVRAAF